MKTKNDHCIEDVNRKEKFCLLLFLRMFYTYCYNSIRKQINITTKVSLLKRYLRK